MDLLSIQDAAMVGVSAYYEWKQKFLTDWNEAIQKGQLKSAWAMMPPELKEIIKKTDPEGYKIVLSVVETD